MFHIPLNFLLIFLFHPDKTSSYQGKIDKNATYIIPHLGENR